MLGWILLGLLTATVGVIVISGVVTKNRIKEKMREKEIEKVLIEQIDRCRNTAKLKDLDSGDTIEIQGDELDDELEEYDIIAV